MEYLKIYYSLSLIADDYSNHVFYLKYKLYNLFNIKKQNNFIYFNNILDY